MSNLINKYNLYEKAFNNVLNEYKTNYANKIELDRKPLIKKLITYGVKIVNCKRRIKDNGITTKENAEVEFNFVEIIKDLMSLLTPREFMQLFPIDKEYKGYRYSMKDYFYTINYIKDFDQDSSIGDKILEFLWEYHNWEITNFNVELMCSVSKLRKFQGEPSIMEEFAETMGIKTYTMHIDAKGKQFLFEKETGKTIRVNKPKEKHLKVIK
ncbi:TPA: phage infection protein [Clostridium botulinum]|uniref:hypothetical protein n=1 Tax=Clostridium botulinum TaxID=1491 RepID=UPI000D0D66A8|nr:hypothetical protein [Clostridium botulinum]PSL96339.1 hypothetical protein C6C12_19155 [Clostridium botulinum]HDK7140050.1 phage infection protein [Clostridium botulinum]HDK7143638.1 phage infection protein [Clostridium botulinum]HDK7147284.1 phage infection protein [Clostridium botulinum]HDK7151026.1 phage infection protein [Clostridium botulinum]